MPRVRSGAAWPDERSVRSSCSGSPRIHAAARTPKRISASDPESLLVAIQARGSCVVSQQGRSATLARSDVASYDSSHPYSVHATTPFELVVFTIPRAVLGLQADRLCGLTAQRIQAGAGLNSIAVPFLLQVAAGSEQGALGEADFDLGEGVIDLVRGLYANDRGAAPPVNVGGRNVMLAHVKSYIETHLGDQDLSAERIAAASAVSVRYLYKLFEPEQITVGEWVRQRRLERRRRDIADPACRADTIMAIATRWGWVSAAHFSRCFHEAYGCSPRAVRRGAQG
ncbi:MAG: helix-turn-helix domain-containing protein [Ilumatobacteraceae bacterium]